MNVQEYISSGIIESYVLGLASPEERIEFERICQSYPEVRAAREAFEASFEKLSLESAVAPPAHLKEEIFSKIRGASASVGKIPVPIHPGTSAPVVAMRWLRFIAAASVLLLVASTLMNYYFFRQYQEYSKKYDELVLSQSQLTSVNQGLQAKLQDYASAFSMMKDPAMAVIKMLGAPKSPSPGSLTTVYWDTRSKDVYLLVNHLPEPVPGKQYQLWALVDGKPVDAGVFDVGNETVSLVKMKNIPRAQAFAITLEKRGGSPSPTMDEMYVIGKVS